MSILLFATMTTLTQLAAINVREHNNSKKALMDCSPIVTIFGPKETLFEFFSQYTQSEFKCSKDIFLVGATSNELAFMFDEYTCDITQCAIALHDIQLFIEKRFPNVIMDVSWGNEFEEEQQVLKEFDDHVTSLVGDQFPYLQ